MVATALTLAGWWALAVALTTASIPAVVTPLLTRLSAESIRRARIGASTTGGCLDVLPLPPLLDVAGSAALALRTTVLPTAAAMLLLVSAPLLMPIGMLLLRIALRTPLMRRMRVLTRVLLRRARVRLVARLRLGLVLCASGMRLAAPVRPIPAVLALASTLGTAAL